MFHVAALVSSFLHSEDLTFAQDNTDVLWIKCSDPQDEFHYLFTRFYDRLRIIHQTLEGCGQDNFVPCVGILEMFHRLTTRFHAAVTKHRGLNLLIRFATKRSTLENLRNFHGFLDKLSQNLELKNEWRKTWKQDCDQMYKVYEDKVKKPQLAIIGLPNAEVAEILAILKFEWEYNKHKLTEKEAELLWKTTNKAARSSGVKIPKISAFYIPSVDVELESNFDVVSGCTLSRGVYDHETRLVAQYLSADDRYARQLFWCATEIWHGFEHPNVAKIVGESLVCCKPCVLWEEASAQGTFIHYFAGEQQNNRKRLWRMFLQVARGLHYIHHQGGTHGNLKCSHILVTADDTPKICHFELCKGSGGAIDPWKGPEYNLGTGLDPSKPGDVYSFGLCIIEARTGDIPYGTSDDDYVTSQLQKEFDCYPRPQVGTEGCEFDNDEWKVVERFVAHNPTDRPTMAQAIEMIEELAWKEAMKEMKLLPASTR
ncbi:Serine/threonine protein kinase [Phytophthora megakarya]|uniref:Serine/threonine protein kinase n=1 Tax=Phytophthora megakarya TaxID=4795 RepID=A0A225WQN5_9STRA|nr:Serine/threonine protein kinase [Phytophthora megakarya]